MSSNKTIKEGNRKILIAFLFLNLLLFLAFSLKYSLSLDLFSQWKEIFDTKYLFLIILYILVILVEGVLSSDIKAKIVFLKFKNPLPGSRSFSAIAKNDSRINLEELKTKIDKIPQKPEEQNNLWYKIYRDYSERPIVYQSHKFFLLTRDLATITLFVITVSFFGYFFLDFTFGKAIIHFLILVSILLLTIMSSQNYGKRFVANVLVEFLNDNKNEKISNS